MWNYNFYGRGCCDSRDHGDPHRLPYCDSQIALIQCCKSVRASRDTVPIRDSTLGEVASHVGMVAKFFMHTLQSSNPL